MRTESPELAHLVSRAVAGDAAVLGDLLLRYRDGLIRLVCLRLDPRLAARVGASDVVQDVGLEAIRRLKDYPGPAKMPFSLWLRLLTRQHLGALARHHLGVEARDPRREVPVRDGSSPGATSALLADDLIARHSSPSSALQRAERRERLTAALDRLDPLDREVLALRHFEQLGNLEVATELGLTESAASKRYVRALERLRNALGNGWLETGSQ